MPYWDLRRKRRQNNDISSGVITSSSPLTWNIFSSQESFHLPQLLAQHCASLWLALHVPCLLLLPPSPVPVFFWYFMIKAVLNKATDKDKVKELNSIISLSGCSLLPQIRHSTLYKGHARRTHEWVLYQFYLHVWIEKHLLADSKVNRGEVWAETVGCEIFPRTDELWRHTVLMTPQERMNSALQESAKSGTH